MDSKVTLYDAPRKMKKETYPNCVDNNKCLVPKLYDTFKMLHLVSISSVSWS
jgi:hypothetical protein